MPYTSHYLKVGHRLVHYRRLGTGPALVMQHASPLTSRSVLSGAEIFAEHFTVIALDNPGYGLSDPLPEAERDNFSAYAHALKDTLEALQLEKPIIYGASTGGAITHLFGSLYPDFASILILDTFSHMDTRETIDGYFPDVTPREDGSHFLAYWNKLNRLFLYKPWHKTGLERRQHRNLPPAAVIHDMFMQQLTAGPEYKYLYRRAIEREDDANIAELKARTLINVWEGSPAYDTVRKYLDGVLPDNYIPIASGLEPGGRYNAMLAWLLGNGFADHAPCTFAQDAAPKQRRFVDTPFGQMHLRCSDGAGGAVVLLHDWAKSSRSFDTLYDQIGVQTNLIAPDLLGHGDTPAAFSAPGKALDECVIALEHLLDFLGVENCTVVGEGAGVILGAALQQRRPRQITKVACLASAPVRLDAAACAEIADAAPDLRPVASGAHIIEAFHQVRSAAAFWRWERLTKDMALARPDAANAARMSQATFDLLRAPLAWSELPGQSAAVVARSEKLQSLLHQVIVLTPKWRVGDKPLAQALPSALGGETIALPDDESTWGMAIAEALEI